MRSGGGGFALLVETIERRSEPASIAHTPVRRATNRASIYNCCALGVQTSPSPAGNVALFGGFRFDISARRLFHQSAEVSLNPKALDVLAYLIENPRRIVSKDEILREVWGAIAVTDDALVQRVLDIRKALHDNAKSPNFIRTHPKRGYEWIATAADEVPPPLLPTPAAAAPEPRRMVWLAIAAVCLVAIATVWLVLGRSETAPRDWHAARLTALSGMEDYPTVDRQGTRVLFASNESGASNLWMLDLHTDRREAVTTGAENDSEPDWSPDGQWVAFRSERQNGGLFVLSMADRKPIRITEFGHHPRWSPDSRRILFHTEGADGRLYVWNRESRTTTELSTSGPAIVNRAFPTWSRDGRAVYFVGLAQAAENVPGGVRLGHQIWRVSAEGGPVRLSTPSFGIVRDGGFDLSPDGASLVFIGLDRGLWTSSIQPHSGEPAGRPKRLTFTTENHQHPRYTSRGEIVFSTVSSPDSIWLLPFEGDKLAPAAKMERLSRDGVLARNVILSPDGTRVAFISWGGERFEIWCLDVKTRKQWRVSPPSGPSRTRPMWSKDGRVLLYQTLEGADRRELAGFLDEAGGGVTSEIEVSPRFAPRNAAFQVSGGVIHEDPPDNLIRPDEKLSIESLRPWGAQRAHDGSLFFQTARGGWFNIWRLKNGRSEQWTHFSGNPYLLSDMNRDFAVHSRGLIVSLRENRADLWMIR